MEVKISIIVPVYNIPENYLRKCLDSLLEQSLNEIEIILIDDGSTNNSGIICDEYSSKDTRINVIHKKNEGLAAARNTGFRAAKGKWIMFVDGDDWLSLETCDYVYKVGEKFNANIVFWGIIKEYGKNSIPYTYNYEDMKLYNKDECKILQAKVLDHDGLIGTAFAKLIRRSYLINNNIFHDETVRQGGEGLEFNIRLFEDIDQVLFVHKHFYHYIFNTNSISASHNENNHYYVIKSFEAIKKFIDKSSNKSLLLESFNKRMIYVMVTTAITGYFNPENKEAFLTKIKKYKKYISNPIFIEALNMVNMNKISFSRRCVVFCIKNNLYVVISLLAWIRRRQLYNR